MYIITKRIIREWKRNGGGRRERGMGGGAGRYGVYNCKTCMYKINVKYVHIWILVLGSRLECKSTHNKVTSCLVSIEPNNSMAYNSKTGPIISFKYFLWEPLGYPYRVKI